MFVVSFYMIFRNDGEEGKVVVGGGDAGGRGGGVGKHQGQF